MMQGFEGNHTRKKNFIRTKEESYLLKTLPKKVTASLVVILYAVPFLVIPVVSIRNSI